jgi:cytosine/adenosine deaminase-related metal-dependent hydrolase
MPRPSPPHGRLPLPMTAPKRWPCSPPHLPTEQQPAVYAEALAAAQAIAAADDRAKALAVLAPHLPTDLLADALAAARAIRYADDRAKALAALAPHLPTEQQPAVYAEALAAARALDEYFRPIVLAVLIPNLPTEQQPAVFAEALTAANAIISDFQRPNALFAIANCPTSCPTLDEQFAPTLRMLAQGGRPALLADLWALQPWLAALAERRQPTMLAALATAISETGRCWP